MDASMGKKSSPSGGRARNMGLRVVTVIYAAVCIYLMTQMGHPPNSLKYPTALSLITATNSFALIGSILGFIVTVPQCKQRTLGSLTVLFYTVGFFLAIAACISVVLTYFSVYWVVFSGLHIFFSMLAVGASYAQFRSITVQDTLDESTPIASAIPQAEGV
ncbi:hypothetical protein Emed_007314 [Eimeria media]